MATSSPALAAVSASSFPRIPRDSRVRQTDGQTDRQTDGRFYDGRAYHLSAIARKTEISAAHQLTR